MLRTFTSSRLSVVLSSSSSSPFLSSSIRNCSAPAGTAAMSSPESNAKIAEMAKLYSQLTLKEISTLQRQIFRELGHSDDFYEQALLRGLGGGGGGGAAMPMNPQMMAAMQAASAPAAGGAAAAEEPKAEVKKAPAAAEKTSFDVSISSYPAEVKIKLVKELRTVVPALSIKEAKDAIDKAPGIIAKALGKDDAEKLKKIMESLGAKVELQ